MFCAVAALDEDGQEIPQSFQKKMKVFQVTNKKQKPVKPGLLDFTIFFILLCYWNRKKLCH